MDKIMRAVNWIGSHMVPSGELVNRFTGSRHTYCHTCDRTHTDGCAPWRS